MTTAAIDSGGAVKAGGPRPRPGAWRIAAALAGGLMPCAGIVLAALIVARKPSDGGDQGPGGAGPAPLPGATRTRRALAAAVDLCVAGALAMVPWAGWALAAGFLLFRDSAFDGLGAGKRLFSLAVVRPDGDFERLLAGDHLSSFVRNATVGIPLMQVLLVPAEAVLALAGAARIGDRLAGGTRVVLLGGGRPGAGRGDGSLT